MSINKAKLDLFYGSEYEKIRAQIASEQMAAIIAGYGPGVTQYTNESLAKIAVEMTEALLNELTKVTP